MSRAVRATLLAAAVAGLVGATAGPASAANTAAVQIYNKTGRAMKITNVFSGPYKGDSKIVSESLKPNDDYWKAENHYNFFFNLGEVNLIISGYLADPGGQTKFQVQTFHQVLVNPPNEACIDVDFTQWEKARHTIKVSLSSYWDNSPKGTFTLGNGKFANPGVC